MLDQSFRDALDNQDIDIDDLTIVNKMSYIMTFGEYTIQYDFSLN